MSTLPKLVPSAPEQRLPDLGKLRRAVGALESTRARGKSGTRALARRALVEVGEVVALIGLHLPIDTSRQRTYERDTFNPILAAIDAATGHCPRCSVRVASWAAPRGPLAFVPCASHKAAP